LAYLYQDMQAETHTARSTTASRGFTSARVLVIDDDRDVCDFMETFLEGDGFEVKTLSKPEDAIDEIRRGEYHLVILDLMMPGTDGLAVLEEIRKHDSDVAVVIYTGYPSLDTAVRSMKLDAIDYLKKPFVPDEFREVIDRVLRKKGLLRSPEEELLRSIGENIRKLRHERGLTLKQLGRRASLSVSLLSQIERAESSASISSLYRVATALDARISDFFGDF
jgi:two-component system, OmpR family, response regulator